ncbi:MAG: shikimate kinase [Desulfobacterales bacterium]
MPHTVHSEFGSGIVDLKSNFVLIGMPGSGKSTVGVLLAKETTRNFIDTDVLIQTAQGRSLQEIVDSDGHMALRRIEEETILALSCRNHVIATGGSAAYSHSAMLHLKAGGRIVFLEVDLGVLESRIRNFDTRGLAKRPGQSFADLYEERYALYRNYADVTIDCSHLNQDQVCEQIIRSFTL